MEKPFVFPKKNRPFRNSERFSTLMVKPDEFSKRPSRPPGPQHNVRSRFVCVCFRGPPQRCSMRTLIGRRPLLRNYKHLKDHQSHLSQLQAGKESLGSLLVCGEDGSDGPGGDSRFPWGGSGGPAVGSDYLPWSATRQWDPVTGGPLTSRTTRTTPWNTISTYRPSRTIHIRSPTGGPGDSGVPGGPGGQWAPCHWVPLYRR